MGLCLTGWDGLDGMSSRVVDVSEGRVLESREGGEGIGR